MNLNNPVDFASATLSKVSGALNQLAGLNKGEWVIEEAAYGHPPGNLVVFHVFHSTQNYSAGVSQVQDSVSRRVVPFEYPYVDGQTTLDLGRSGESIDFDVVMHGDGYYAGYLALIQEFNNPLPGTLIHPVRGRMTVKFKEATVLHKSEAAKAVTLRLRFVEHNFEISFQSAPPTTKSVLADAVNFISLINGAITAVQSNLITANQVQQAIAAAIQGYHDDYTQTLVAINTTFNAGSSSDIPGLLPVNSSAGSAFPSGAAPNDPFASLTPAEIQAQQAVPLSAAQAVDKVANNRVLATAAISLMEAANGGLGALDFYDQILTIKQSAISIQKALELALSSSNAAIKQYTTPLVMGLREVCFANGIAVDRAYELEVLNPNLLSTNLIPPGTVLQVPTS